MNAQEILDLRAKDCKLSSTIAPFIKSSALKECFSKNPFLMAPMAGVSDAAYRLMTRAGGAALAYTEMVSCAGIHYGGAKTWELVDPNEAEPDICVQLFGSKPEQFKEATAQVCERIGDKLALIDINMACPVPKVVKKGEGSALLDNPKLAQEIVRATASEASCPVSVKIRRGRRIGEECAPSFAQALEDAGAAVVAVHGRYANQLYQGKSSREAIKRVVEAVSIPVIGSGDVVNAQAACEMLEQTGASAVMIARGSYGTPWIFKQACTLLKEPSSRAQQEFKEPSPQERLKAFYMHVELLSATKAHLPRARLLAGFYLKGLPFASRARKAAMSCSTKEEFLELISAYLEDLS